MLYSFTENDKNVFEADKMKKIIITLIAAFVLSSALYAVAGVPYGYLNVSWRAKEGRVKSRLVRAGLIKTNATNKSAVSVEIYQNNYSDPELVWYNRQLGKWISFSFTTNLEQLMTVEPDIRYLTKEDKNTFSMLKYEKNDLTVSNRNWVYRFYFYKGYAFAVSVRYENSDTNSATGEFGGYKVPAMIFEANNDAFHEKYGGADVFNSVVFDRYSVQKYEGYFGNGTGYKVQNGIYKHIVNVNDKYFDDKFNYIEGLRADMIYYDSVMTVYYQEFFGGKANYTISYIDDQVIYVFYPKLQDDIFFDEKAGQYTNELYYTDSVEENTIRF